MVMLPNTFWGLIVKIMANFWYKIVKVVLFFLLSFKCLKLTEVMWAYQWFLLSIGTQVGTLLLHASARGLQSTFTGNVWIIGEL